MSKPGDIDPRILAAAAQKAAVGAIPTLIDQLADVDTSTTPPTDGQGFIFHAATGLWIPGNLPAPGATSLDGLSDVDTSTAAPTDGQVLEYHASSGLWLPTTLPGPGAEAVQDIVGAFLVAGANIALNYNDPANQLTITAGTDTEAVQDIVGALLAAGPNITLNYDDSLNVLTISASGSSPKWTVIEDFTISSGIATHDVDVSAYDAVLVMVKDVTLATLGTRQLLVSSSDAPTTFWNTSGDYTAITTDGVATASTALNFHSVGNVGARSGIIRLEALRNTTSIKVAQNNNTTDGQLRFLTKNTNAISKIRFQGSAGGNMTGGRLITFGK